MKMYNGTQNQIACPSETLEKSRILVARILDEHRNLGISEYDLHNNKDHGIMLGKEAEGDTLVWRVNLRDSQEANLFDGVLKRIAGMEPIKYLLACVPNDQTSLHSELGAFVSRIKDEGIRLVDYTAKLAILTHDKKVDAEMYRNPQS